MKMARNVATEQSEDLIMPGNGRNVTRAREKEREKERWKLNIKKHFKVLKVRLIQNYMR